MGVLNHFLHSVRTRGPLETMGLSAKTVIAALRAYAPSNRRALREQREFDRQFGVETTEEVTLGRMGAVLGDKAHAGWYLGGPITELFEALRELDLDFPTTSFIDLGAGKGRALFIAAQFPFREVVGVEFSPKIADVASRNIDNFSRSRSRQHPAITVHCMDAREYSFTSGNVCLYMFNPFDATVLRPVMENLVRALATGTVTSARIIYVNPIESQLISQYLSLVKRVLRPGVDSYDVFSSS